MEDYPLASVVTVNGTFAITLKNATVTELTEPTIQTILSIDAVEETLDVKAVTTEIPKLMITVRDDYSTHTATGFWYEVLAGDVEILVTLDEGAGATHFFYGTLNKELIDWSEHYVSTTRIRTARITFDSIIKTMLESSLSDWIDEIAVNAHATFITPPTGAAKIVQFDDFFASLLFSSGLNPDENLLDVTFAIGTADFKYSLAAVEYGLNELRIATHYDSTESPDPPDVVLTNYFLPAHANYIPKHYDSVSAFLSDLCRNFAIVLRLGYSSGRHTITVMQRGRAYSGVVTFGTPERLKQSSITLATNIIEKNIRATQLLEPTYFAWSDRWGQILTSAAYDNVDFGDIDFKTVFSAFGQPEDTAGRGIWVGVNDASLEPVDEVEAHNYDTPGYQSYTGVRCVEQACVYYYYHRYALSRKRIIRTYGTMKADDATPPESHEHIHILRRTSIDDGSGAANYFANSVKKVPISNELEIEWIEE